MDETLRLKWHRLPSLDASRETFCDKVIPNHLQSNLFRGEEQQYYTMDGCFDNGMYN